MNVLNMNRVIVRPRPVVAGTLAAVVLCALAGSAFGVAGTSIPRAPSHRAPILNWLTDDLPRTDAAVLNAPVTLPRGPLARPASRWRGTGGPTTAPRGALFRSHITRISLPPPAPGTP